AKYLFTPLAMAVVFAMLASYLLSRTIVPTLVRYLLASETHGEAGKGRFARVHDAFQRRFEQLRAAYVRRLEIVLARRALVLTVFAVVTLSGLAVLPFVGRDFFPTVDTGQFRLHVRAPAGTRIEETEQVFADVEATIRRLIPKDEIQLVIDNIGQPQPVNLGFTDNVSLGASDGEILVSLNPE